MLPSSELENFMASLIDAKERGMSWDDVRGLIRELASIRRQVMQFELCVVPHEVRAREELFARGAVVHEGNVVRINPLPKPSFEPPKGGAA
jgi:hypothetical protein